ncbi:fumarylacetoacetate hydrolase family protein [Gordonia phosphorivorans]|uniref:Fumarylacetoacetate hydrolase family protein n=2 Tax=Gordonia phosphorivorans TaxID=1056982 RepID=A0ABV6H7D8_9ACTN
MYLATIRLGNTTRAVKRIEKDGQSQLVDLGYADVRALLDDPDGLAKAAAVTDGTAYATDTADFAPPILDPEKVVCVAHNYGEHFKFLGLSVPEHPRLSTKFSSSLIGPNDPIVTPADAHALDAAVELTIVIGKSVRHADDAEAAAAIAGFTVMNDVADRSVAFETDEWALGDVWDRSTPMGPYVVTPDELPGGLKPQVNLSTTIDDTERQSGHSTDLHFDPVHVVRRVSRFMQLSPGDVIATGSPVTPGHRHGADGHLKAGQVVVAAIEGIGECRNTVVAS